MKSLIFLLSVVALCAHANQAVDEDGYYSWWQQLKNKKFPPPADKPLTIEDAHGPFPLVANPMNFSDGFDPKKYNRWQQVELHKETGAVCGNGSDFHFYVRRSHTNKNVVLMFEPGGACWDYASCTGKAGVRGARNPNGIPDHYIHQIQVKLSSPFLYSNLLKQFAAKDWSLVYVPYCTGDVHVGDTVVTYEDPEGEEEPLVWHHKGMRNTRAVMAWLRENLPAPHKMLSTGCSAGGTGAVVQYYLNRMNLNPAYSYLFNDSGPVFMAPLDQNTAEYPSIKLHQKIRQMWNVDPYLDYLKEKLPGFDTNNMGSANSALANNFPQDRFMHSHFQMDLNYSSYSYERFYPELFEAQEQKEKRKKIRQLWQHDTQMLMHELEKSDNWGYYFPYFRNLNESHCTSILEFGGSDIQEQGIEFLDAINNLLDDDTPLMRSFENDSSADLARPVSWLWDIVNGLLGVDTENQDDL